MYEGVIEWVSDALDLDRDNILLNTNSGLSAKETNIEFIVLKEGKGRDSWQQRDKTVYLFIRVSSLLSGCRMASVGGRRVKVYEGCGRQ